MRRLAASLLIAICALATVAGQKPADRRPLSATDIDDIATLLKLEDTRTFDEAALTRIAASTHPEVRRRAVVSMGRIVVARGRVVLSGLRGETDAELLATIVFSTGQQKDPGAIPWLSGLLSDTRTPTAVAKEAAQALGKLAATPDAAAPARAALAQYLLAARESVAASPVIGEALLAIGRFTAREDLTPVVRWTTARDTELRWRAAWALFRPKDPAAIPHLMTISADASADVRFWALRGLAPAQVDASGVSRAATSARLRQGLNDPDRRVRTEALRALTAYDDEASVEAVLAATRATDTWLSVSATESLGRWQARAAVVVPALVAASGEKQPLSVRLSALTPLVTLAPDAARTLATALANDASVVAQTAATQALRQLDAAARAAQATPGAAAAGRGGAGGAGRGAARPALTARPESDYRMLVTRWIVPDYSGDPKPRVVLGTPRGEMEIELNAGDAPFGVEYLWSVIESGEIVNTEFGRVVPNFVAQQRAIRSQGTLRDEVNRRGLLRGTLSWASSGLDTGRPGYTLGSTPQPHNEGDFTALGRVVSGVNVIDQLELGDRITSARTKK